MLRTLIERVTRYWKFKRRLTKEFGRKIIWVSPGAGLRFLFRPMVQTEPVLFAFAQEFVKKGDVVWDVGANVGLFAFSAAYITGKEGDVVAIEPDLWLVSLLRKSVMIQGADTARVSVISAAAAREAGIRSFYVARRSRATNYLEGYGSSQTGGVREEQLIMTITLDWLSRRFALPDVLKIDVEGAELEVLQGASEIFKKKRPVVLCEVFEEHSEEVTRFFKERDYKLYNADEYFIKEKREVQEAKWNTLAVPVGENIKFKNY